MNGVFFYNNIYNFDYNILFDLNLVFVDIIRNSGGNNKERLLIVAGANDELDMTSLQTIKFQ